MIKTHELKVVICVMDSGEGLIVKHPENLPYKMNGSWCHDNNFEGVPKESGFFECVVERWFSQGYSTEGYEDEGQSEWVFKIINSTPLLSFLSKGEWNIIKHALLYSASNRDNSPHAKTQYKDLFNKLNEGPIA